MILEEIPLIPGEADQTADIVLGGKPFSIRVTWNDRGEFWTLTISQRGGDPIIAGVKLVERFPLTGRLYLLGLAGDLYFAHRGGKSYRPGFDDLGAAFGLFYYDSETPPVLPVPLSPTVAG
ncbi:MAG: phage baseplate plug family protein [Burkholderiaceae bacterium]